ncbi:electron transport complex subunit RsxC [Oceanospirillum sediminis]|uniref:Ion-translocating oxidoreductase complex subunit C n=1 Tax=Oceanospirillum sediminis TaxID=2760088 RepID=A0A839ITE2_9GAMM|nr:electron transport complex subunit RsxC [Oceanospirillum sediminis]MBB1487749.1 electron transport complex subunit RsxC [Oceanospirillum sediminis]
MRTVWDFHGGIHPEENKQQSTQFPIVDAPLPKKVILPLQQHIGAPAEPVVLIGEKVRTGQLIAKADGFISANIHATISGTVVAIEDHAIPHASGMTDECIIIESDGQDEWIDLHPVKDWENADVETLLNKIAEAGIVGMGGAGFPTAVKARTRERHDIDTLVINAAECEPYITSDDMAMRTYPEQVIEGAKILCQLVNPSSCLIGIEDNKPEAIAALEAAAKGTHIEVVVVPTKYPSGGEKQLIRILTGREVPSGGLPADIGVVCQNVGTTIAIYKAIAKGEPLISRITTLTGSAFTRLQNFEVRLGTPINELLELGGFKNSLASRLIMGGPMMGFSLQGDELPVVKTTNCLLAPTHQEFPDPEMENPCIRCGMCEQACPAELLPQQLHWFSKAQEFEKAQLFNLFDCIECGACAFVCPSHIPLVQYYRYAKSEIRREDEEAKKAERAKIRFEQRQARLERQEAEAAARRKARMSASAKPAAKPAAKANEAATTAVDEAEQKKLKIQRAAAAVSVKKAEKALAEAKENNTDNLTELEQNLKGAQQKLADIDSKLGSAKPAAKPAASASGQVTEEHEKALKQAKIAAAASKAAIKKAEKALATAQEAGDTDEIKAKESDLATAKANAEKAADKLKQLQSTPPAAPQTNAAASEEHEKALKQAKIAAAASKAAIKKAEKALATAQEAGDADEIKAKEETLTIAKANAEKAADKLKQLQAAPASAVQPTSDSAQQAYETAKAEHEKSLKQAKIAAAASKAAIKKAEKALTAAQEAGDADEIKAKEDILNTAQSKAEAAAKKLEELKNNPPAAPAPQTAANAQTPEGSQAASSTEDDVAAREKALKQAKIAAAASKAAVKKAEKALQAAQDSGDAATISECEQTLSQAQTKAQTAADKLEAVKASQAVEA